MEARNARRANIGQGPYVRPDTSGQDLTGELLNAGSIAMSPVPVVGDILGLAADARMYQTDPASRTMGNYGMTLAGLLPFIPGAAAVRSAKAIEEAASRGLDMSQGARMQRAAEQGFLPQTFYHGTPDSRGILESGFSKQGAYGRGEDVPIFVSADKRLASTYADDSRAWDYQNSTPETLPLRIMAENPVTFDWGGRRFKDASQGNVYPTIRDAIEAAKAKGHDAVTITNVVDDYRAKGAPSTITAIFDPANIRSVNAAFDPTKRNSANLMAGVAGGTVGLSALRNINNDEQPSK
jgi:hypothetical protein